MENIPHLGQISVHAIVYKQLPDGSFHPESVWFDSFSLNLLESSGKECIDKIKAKLEDLKNDQTNRPDPVA